MTFASTTPAADKVPKADGTGVIAAGWLPASIAVLSGTNTQGTLQTVDSNEDLTDSLIAQGTITGALTVSKSGSTAREVTFPDADLTVAGTNVAQTYTAVQTYTTGLLVAADVQASGSGGLALKSSNGTTVATFGAGPGTGTTLAGGLNVGGTGTFSGILAVTSTNPQIRIKDTDGTSYGLLVGGADTTALQRRTVSTDAFEATAWEWNHSAQTVTSNYPLTLSGSNALTVGGGCSIDGTLNLGPNTELTIASGAITKTGSYHKIDTESDAASDDLDTISGGADGDILTIRTTVNTRDVVVKHATGNIHLDGDADFTLSTRLCTLTLRYDGDASGWVEIGRATITT